jgi:DNA-binding FadR family transcriptional regulator
MRYDKFNVIYILDKADKLPKERELCESFGVSLTALREALRRLIAWGLISLHKESGVYISELITPNKSQIELLFSA